VECVGEAYRQIPLKSLIRAHRIRHSQNKCTKCWNCNTGRPPAIQRGGIICHQIFEEDGNDNIFF
jgi:hypothetical protein